MGGSLAGCDSWFAQSQSQVSAHFGVGLLGEVHQYVDLGMMAWANGILEPGNRWPGPAGVNPNALTVSIETEDAGSNLTPVSLAQYNAVVQVGAFIVRQCPTVKTLMTHSVISPQSRVYCPGERWLKSGQFNALAAALGLTPLK